VYLGDEPLTVERWLEGVRAQRTFMSTGPLLFLEVAGRRPGEEIVLGAGDSGRVRVTADATSIAPMERMEIVGSS
jgi:hypothetical protein